MDFALNKEQELFGSYVRKYLTEQGTTNIARAFINGDRQRFDQAFQGLVELGYPSINVSEDYAGMGLGLLDMVLPLEEMGRSVLPGLFLETNSFAVPLIEKYGTEEQKQKYLPAIADGSLQISVAWIEPKGSYTASSIQLRGVEKGDEFVLNGVKSLVADVELADTFLVPIRTTSPSHEEGISLFLVDKAMIKNVTQQQSIDETRKLSQIYFEDVIVNKEQLIGELNEGDNMLEEGLLSFNASICAIMVGCMAAIVDMAAEYAKIREQFGQPIGRFQAIKHAIANMKVDLELSRSLSYYANWAYDTTAEDRQESIFAARIFIHNALQKAAAANVQIHGGIGFTEELDCHLYVKRARYYEHYLGSSECYYEKAAAALGW
ncbi:acyl-CoA/acyl-ACP dehydrogenase [Cytobacillus kochii]|uniref:acyl-CoA dehydrogenase family protein n=1 Tax=Cytobacillus kochii TaxID=859143 RepID=UPI0025A1E68A|nr:acyl-CoA dehydrogenase family protein [Cytobacillus kochii]MDM5209179.1 acyl-CoA dehydrogenase family protein [Cytobacillus kochii]